MKALLFFLFTFNAFAWGPTGHRVVGEIAESKLNIIAKAKIKKILDGHSLARVSNWPDKIKSDPDNYGHTYRWHFTDWPDGQRNYDPVNNNGSLVKSIEDQIKVISNRKAKKADKAFALKFLVHLVGDLHQPLHVGNGKDRGGNRCRVVFHKEEVNLHHLWDERMIQFSKLSFTELSKFVSVDKTKDKSLKNGKAVDWAKESKDLRAAVYPEDPNPAQAQDGVPSYCREDIVLTKEELPQLSYKYSYVHMPTLEKRLYQAGVRLAWLINNNLK